MNNQSVLLNWEKVIDKLRRITMKKILLYGTSRYEPRSKLFDFWMCFSDVHRKTLRLEKLTKDASAGDMAAELKLIDDYKDIANYAIMAVQILEGDEDGIRTDCSSR